MNGWLIDKSAFVRLRHHPSRDQWISMVERGLVQITSVTLLEIGTSALNEDDWNAVIDAPPIQLMPTLNLTPQIEDRALEIQWFLTTRGHHRAPSVPDLLIAASADVSGLRLLAYDKDFALIAEFTGQPIDTLDVL